MVPWLRWGRLGWCYVFPESCNRHSATPPSIKTNLTVAALAISKTGQQAVQPSLPSGSWNFHDKTQIPRNETDTGTFSFVVVEARLLFINFSFSKSGDPPFEDPISENLFSVQFCGARGALHRSRGPRGTVFPGLPLLKDGVSNLSDRWSRRLATLPRPTMNEPTVTPDS